MDWHLVLLFVTFFGTLNSTSGGLWLIVCANVCKFSKMCTEHLNSIQINFIQLCLVIQEHFTTLRTCVKNKINEEFKILWESAQWKVIYCFISVWRQKGSFLSLNVFLSCLLRLILSPKVLTKKCVILILYATIIHMFIAFRTRTNIYIIRILAE